jgi:FMN-dependent dehydrogenase
MGESMNGATELSKTRRKFLKMLSASPLLAGPGFLADSFANLLAAGEVTDKKFLGWLDSVQQSDEVISSPEQALEVMDFEPAARKALPPAHFGYLATGVDDDGTVRANREGYSRIQIRARRLVDVAKIDMSASLFGMKWNTPLVLSPVSGQKAFHPEGEVAVARAAGKKGHLMMLSTVATSSIEDSSIQPMSGKSGERSSSAPRLRALRRLCSPWICKRAATAKPYSARNARIRENAPLVIRVPTRAMLAEGAGEAPEVLRSMLRGSRCLMVSISRRSLRLTRRI